MRLSLGRPRRGCALRDRTRSAGQFTVLVARRRLLAHRRHRPGPHEPRDAHRQRVQRQRLRISGNLGDPDRRDLSGGGHRRRPDFRGHRPDLRQLHQQHHRVGIRSRIRLRDGFGIRTRERLSERAQLSIRRWRIRGLQPSLVLRIRPPGDHHRPHEPAPRNRSQRGRPSRRHQRPRGVQSPQRSVRPI